MDIKNKKILLLTSFFLISAICFNFILKEKNEYNTISNKDINYLINHNSEIQAVVGSVLKSIPLKGGFSGDEVYLINDAFVLKRFKIYNSSMIEIQKQAAKLNIAPNIFCENSKEHFVLMEFVGNFPVPRDQHIIKNLACFLKTLHQITPTKDILHFDLLKKSQNALQFLQNKDISQDILNKLTKVFEFEKYKDYDSVVCHNDLNPGNFLFMNNKVVAIDWDSVCLNDPYYDLGLISIWYMNIPEIEKNLLHQYLGRDPKEIELNHFNVMKKVAMALCGVNLIKAGIQMGCEVGPEIPNDSLYEFLRKIGKGEVKLDSGKKLYEFGLILLKEIK